MPADSELLFALLALQSGGVTREQLLEAEAAKRALPNGSLAAVLVAKGVLTATQVAAVQAKVAESVTALPSSTGSRYGLREEIGRGGLGRVLDAWDTALRRGVAIKVLHETQAGDSAERFAREARLAARLEHPAIIPVYDFGILDEPGSPSRVFLAMKRVQGRDLDRVLRALAEGQAEAIRTWTRARLLRVFQDVCLGMAFAHDRGVVHRDLKPSNIMIGDYGETLIVDWGLAKEMKASVESSAAAEDAPGDLDPVVGDPDTTVRLRAGLPEPSVKDTDVVLLSRAPGLTIDGDIIGTPAYMSPEQAEGRVDSIDGRSDIFALGAILYEILALRSPFEGKTVQEVIARVRTGAIAPPSAVTRSPDPVSPELDAICLRALARTPANRFQTAREFHDEIQLFVEGVRQREAQRAAAEAAVGKVHASLGLRSRLREDAAKATAEAKRLEAVTAPLDDKSVLWEAEDRAQALWRSAAAAHADAISSLARALEHDRGHAEARAIRADLAWESFLEAEESGDVAAALVHRRAAEEFHDGRLTAQLRGEGTLAIRTLAFPCDCLARGRAIDPAEFATGEWHPFSGRSLAGTVGAEGLTALEPGAPIRLRVHAASCVEQELPGAGVWLFRHAEIGRRLIPVTPPGATGPAVPEAAISALYERDSPFRPQGPGLHLGRTPVAQRSLATGSWLLVVVRDGHAPARIPVFIPRGGAVEQDVTLFRTGEVPDGFCSVAEGTFGLQGDRENPYAGPAETKTLPAFFIARHPVTCREYAEFLDACSLEEASRRAPREAPGATSLWAGLPWSVRGARRLPNCPAEWQEDWPVTGVSWEDAVAFAAWKRSRDGYLYTLPTSTQWEKAARGPDRRFYPWGPHLDPRWANSERSHEGGPRPAPVTEFPGDASPYGVRGLAGNTRDACLDDAGSDLPGRRQFRGGTWGRPAIEMRASDRTAMGGKMVVFDFGFRLAGIVRLPAAGGKRPSP